jgi:hypothetical protein
MREDFHKLTAPVRKTLQDSFDLPVGYKFTQKAVESAQCYDVMVISKLCYTDNRMQIETISLEARSSWPRWADSLRRHGLENIAAWALEAAGPLTVLGAQILYLSGPFLRPGLADEQRDALADLLENQEEALAFATFLRKDQSL